MNRKPNMKKVLLTAVALIAAAATIEAKPRFDWSLTFVPEEGGVKFEKITEDADRVADYDGKLVRHATRLFGNSGTLTLDWWVIPQIGISPDGRKLG